MSDAGASVVFEVLIEIVVVLAFDAADIISMIL